MWLTACIRKQAAHSRGGGKEVPRRPSAGSPVYHYEQPPGTSIDPICDPLVIPYPFHVFLRSHEQPVPSTASTARFSFSTLSN